MAAAQETLSLLRQGRSDVIAIALQVDVTKESDVRHMIKATVQEFGRIDCCCNNAGITRPMARLHETKEEDFDQVININLKGVWLCMKYEIEQFLQQEPREPGHHTKGKIRGNIVNTNSLAATTAFPKMVPYSASEWGLSGITKTAAAEYTGDGIRINEVQPTFVDTPMVRNMLQGMPLTNLPGARTMGRVVTPEEIAEGIFYLGSNICPAISGSSLRISGGETL